jgi:hypothetical protein
MPPSTRFAAAGALVLLVAAGCQSAADRRREAVVADAERWLAEDRRLAKQDPRPLGNGYPAACPVHGTPLREDVVPIVYGAPMIVPELARAMRTEFPLASTHVSGGCCVGYARRHEVKFCPDCRTAEAKWNRDYLATHPWLADLPAQDPFADPD